MNPYDKAHELARILKEVPEVVEYKRARERVDSNENDKKMLEDLRSKQIELYTLQMQGKQPDKEQVDAFNSLWSVVSMNLSIRNFLEAEMQFSKLWQDILKILGDAVEVDLGFGPAK